MKMNSLRTKTTNKLRHGMISWLFSDAKSKFWQSDLNFAFINILLVPSGIAFNTLPVQKSPYDDKAII